MPYLQQYQIIYEYTYLEFQGPEGGSIYINLDSYARPHWSTECTPIIIYTNIHGEKWVRFTDLFHEEGRAP